MSMLEAARWITVENTESTPAPPYGVVEVIGVREASSTALPAVKVRRPTSANLAPGRLLMLGPTGLGESGRGQAHAIYPGLALYEASAGLVSLSGTLGTAANSYKLTKGNTGFRALEATTAGQDVLLVAVDGSMLTVEEVDGSPSCVAVAKIQFDQGDGFLVTEMSPGVTRVDMRAATPSQAGIVGTTTQEFGGDKVFVDGVVLSDHVLYGGASMASVEAGLTISSLLIQGELYATTGVVGGPKFSFEGGPGWSTLYFTIDDESVSAGAVAYRIKKAGTTYTGQTGTYAGLEFHGGILKGGSFSGGSGTVTSVAMTVPSILSVAGSPVTTSGTLAVTLANQSANTLFAGPTSGGAAAPTFRAQVVADLPTFTGLTASDIALDDEFPYYDTSATANRKITFDRAAGFALRAVADGRLTLSSGNPWAGLHSDITAATSLYYTPTVGSRIALYDGTRWKLYTFAEVTLSSPTLTNAIPYDVWLYDNSGTLTLEVTAWTDATTRATALTTQDGVYVKSGATTRRYLGTILPSAANQMSDASYFRGVWNQYNQTSCYLNKTVSGSGYTYATATIRHSNNDNTNRITVVTGQNGMCAISLKWCLYKDTTTASAAASVMIGVDSAADNSTGYAGPHHLADGFDMATYDGRVALGAHIYYSCERGAGAGSQAWYPQSGAAFSGYWTC